MAEVKVLLNQLFIKMIEKFVIRHNMVCDEYVLSDNVINSFIKVGIISADVMEKGTIAAMIIVMEEINNITSRILDLAGDVTIMNNWLEKKINTTMEEQLCLEVPIWYINKQAERRKWMCVELKLSSKIDETVPSLWLMTLNSVIHKYLYWCEKYLSHKNSAVLANIKKEYLSRAHMLVWKWRLKTYRPDSKIFHVCGERFAKLCLDK